jgi:hypothetical protein
MYIALFRRLAYAFMGTEWVNGKLKLSVSQKEWSGTFRHWPVANECSGLHRILDSPLKILK